MFFYVFLYYPIDLYSLCVIVVLSNDVFDSRAKSEDGFFKHSCEAFFDNLIFLYQLYLVYLYSMEEFIMEELRQDLINMFFSPEEADFLIKHDQSYAESLAYGHTSTSDLFAASLWIAETL